METSFLSATLLLLLITDPLGNIPLFIASLKSVAPSRHKTVILRECLIAFGVLALFMVLGSHVLAWLHLSDAALRVAGGVILLLIAIRMVFPDHGTQLGDEPSPREPFIVPIAIPLIAGPSALATVLLLGSREPHRMLAWFGALAIAIAVSYVIFSLSNALKRVLGEQVITAMERLMGLVLTTLAVEMLLGGVTSYIQHVKN